MVFMGTIISTELPGTVTATGKRTELGKISGLIQIEEEEPPSRSNCNSSGSWQSSFYCGNRGFVEIARVRLS
jgi:magnesium-transporting ATPase (P-type)